MKDKLTSRTRSSAGGRSQVQHSCRYPSDCQAVTAPMVADHVVHRPAQYIKGAKHICQCLLPPVLRVLPAACAVGYSHVQPSIRGSTSACDGRLPGNMQCTNNMHHWQKPSSNDPNRGRRTLPIDKVAEVHAKVYTTVLPSAHSALQTVQAVSVVPCSAPVRLALPRHVQISIMDVTCVCRPSVLHGDF